MNTFYNQIMPTTVNTDSALDKEAASTSRAGCQHYILLELIRSERALHRQLAWQQHMLRQLATGAAQLLAVLEEKKSKETVVIERYHSLHELLLAAETSSATANEEDPASITERIHTRKVIDDRLVDTLALAPKHSLLYGSLRRDSCVMLIPYLRRWMTRLVDQLPQCCQHCLHDCDGAHEDGNEQNDASATAMDFALTTTTRFEIVCQGLTRILTFIALVVDDALLALQCTADSTKAMEEGTNTHAKERGEALTRLLREEPCRSEWRYLLVDVEEVRDVLVEEMQHRRTQEPLLWSNSSMHDNAPSQLSPDCVYSVPGAAKEVGARTGFDNPLSVARLAQLADGTARRARQCLS